MFPARLLDMSDIGREAAFGDPVVHGPIEKVDHAHGGVQVVVHGVTHLLENDQPVSLTFDDLRSIALYGNAARSRAARDTIHADPAMRAVVEAHPLTGGFCPSVLRWYDETERCHLQNGHHGQHETDAFGPRIYWHHREEVTA